MGDYYRDIELIKIQKISYCGLTTVSLKLLHQRLGESRKRGWKENKVIC